ncbi:hypothetical protein [Thermococcus waiotapuensis]|uniref:Uncharacterized protein n=1 Tax=Thermococcus waiotapuensis TaxID=90909 RepID=A0AAE4NWT9_9EURY|nr:hypothetical protein [Thermococcus waiotapuensis]MDV3104130.1 hypothetical protein [Thermococcus waiotapuensis]
MKEVTIRGKHILLKIHFQKALDLVFPFPVLLFIDGNLTTGVCWIDEKGNKKLYPIQGDPAGIIQELLYCCDFLMKGKELEAGGFIGNLRKYARKLDLPVKEYTKLYYTSLVIYMGEYIFELGEDTINVHYHNIPLKDTNCPEFRGKHKGTVSIPLPEFVEDVLKISGEFLERHIPVVEEILLEYWKEPRDYGYLWKLYREVIELYKEKFRRES